MIPFSPLSEFEESEVLAGELEQFYLTTAGGQFINAMREYALYLDGRQAGTAQDGARAVVDKMLSLSLSRRNERIERMKQHQRPSSRDPARQLTRKPPPPPAPRAPKPDPEKKP